MELTRGHQGQDPKGLGKWRRYSECDGHTVGVAGGLLAKKRDQASRRCVLTGRGCGGVGGAGRQEVGAPALPAQGSGLDWVMAGAEGRKRSSQGGG